MILKCITFNMCHGEGLDTDVNKLLNDFVDFQEKSLEKLKQYL